MNSDATSAVISPKPKTAIGRRFVAAIAAGGLLLAACGSDDVAAPAETTVAEDSAMVDMLGAFGPACDSVPTEGEGSFAGMADDTAATAASNNPVLSTLVTAVVEADLVDTLNSDGPFTIFAPTNDAFAAVPEDVLSAVLADKDLLTSILTYHVIGGESLEAEALAGAEFDTVEGGSISLGADGTVVNDVNVVCSNVPVANGTVHIVDGLLLPQVALDAIASMTGDAMEDDAMEDDAMEDEAMEEEAMEDDAMADGNLVQTGVACSAVPADGEGSFAGMADDTAATAASSNPVLSTLVTAVVEADLVDTLNSDGPFTIFAPTNDAFAAIPADQLNAVLADKDVLTSVLTFHVVAGEKLSAADLIEMGTVTTVNGAELTIAAEGDAISVNGSATSVCQDVTTANATVHIIDSVLLPG